MNENLAAFSRLIPKANAVTIVLPLLEIPGNIANAWAMPMIKLLDFFRGLSAVGKNLDIIIIAPVILSIVSTSKTLEKRLSI